MSSWILRFKNGYNEVVIELRVKQFWSAIILMISNQTCAAYLFDFKFTFVISVQIHSTQFHYHYINIHHLNIDMKPPPKKKKIRVFQSPKRLYFWGWNRSFQFRAIFLIIERKGHTEEYWPGCRDSKERAQRGPCKIERRSILPSTVQVSEVILSNSLCEFGAKVIYFEPAFVNKMHTLWPSPWKQSLWQNKYQVRTNPNVWISYRAILL